MNSRMNSGMDQVRDLAGHGLCVLFDSELRKNCFERR